MVKFGKLHKIKGNPIYKEKCEHDKNTIHLPRQEFLFCLNLLILCGFSCNSGVRYNDFTTFEKCSDMTEMGDNTISCTSRFFEKSADYCLEITIFS